jgi:hypothetical protein
MTRECFRGLRRGDLVKVDCNGHCVVEAVSYCDRMFRVDLRLMSGELVKAIPESECEIIRPILEGVQRMNPPETTLGMICWPKSEHALSTESRVRSKLGR